MRNNSDNMDRTLANNHQGDLSSTIPLICVCDKATEEEQKSRSDGVGVLRPLQSLQNTSDLRRHSELYKSLSSASTSSDQAATNTRIKPKSGSDENLLKAKTTNIRQSFLKTSQAAYPPSSSYSPSSVLSTSSSLRLSTQNNSPQSKAESSLESSPRNLTPHLTPAKLHQINQLKSHYTHYHQRMKGPGGHFYPGLGGGHSSGVRQFDYEEEDRAIRYPPGYSYSQADSSSTTSSANNRFTVHSYQFIEDYENISPRLIHSANLMHYGNTLARTSLLDPVAVSPRPSHCPEMDPVDSKSLQSDLSESGRSLSQTRINQSAFCDLRNEADQSRLKTKRFLPSIPSCPQIDEIKKSEATSSPSSKPPGPLKGILVKHKNSKSLSSLVTRTEEEPADSVMSQGGPQPSSKLNRASLHLPLSSHKVSPCLPPPAPVRPPEEKITYNLYRDMTEVSGLLTDSQPSGPESFTLSEVATQTEIHYSNGVSCLTTAKLLLGVVVSAVSLVMIIFIMKCKFKIGFQMNMCHYM